MKPKEYEVALQLALDGLKRVDKTLVFAETKVAFIVALVSFATSLLIDHSAKLNALLISGEPYLFWLSALAALLIVLGIIIVFYCSLVIVFPRLKVSPKNSYLYFASIEKVTLTEFAEQFYSLSKKAVTEQALDQLHAVSRIAKKKFQYLQVTVVGAFLVFVGWLIVVGLIFFGN